MDRMNGLVEQWNNLWLSEEEQDTIVVGEDIPDKERIKERCSLVRKIFSDRSMSWEIVRGTMGRIWRINKQAAFTKVGKNTSIITFATKTNKYRVMSGKLWLFDGSLFALKDLDGQHQIAKTQFELESFWVNSMKSQ